jgi:hypothetical protein
VPAFAVDDVVDIWKRYVTAKRHRIPGTTGKPRVLYMLPPIDDDLDVETKNALALRNAASTSGVCPSCGATAEVYADPEYALVFHAVFRHESWCLALTDAA